jgi:glycosyltransferase 2 family protein
VGEAAQAVSAGGWKARLRRLLPLVGLALFAWLLLHIGVEDIARELREADWLLLALSLTLAVPIALLQTLRWRAFLKSCGIPLGVVTVLRYHLLGLFYGVITPGKVGSFVRILLIAEVTEAPLKDRFLSVVFDRFSDIVAMSLLAAGGCILLAFRGGQVVLGWAMVALTLGGLVGFFALSRLRANVLDLLSRVLVPQAARRRFGAGLDELELPHPAELIWPLALAQASWVMMFLQGYMVALAVGFDMRWWEYVLVMPIASIVGLIPITISGFGTRDAAVVSLAAMFGIPPNKAVGLSLLAYLINAVFPSLLGAALAATRGLSGRKGPQLEG